MAYNENSGQWVNIVNDGAQYGCYKLRLVDVRNFSGWSHATQYPFLWVIQTFYPMRY